MEQNMDGMDWIGWQEEWQFDPFDFLVIQGIYLPLPSLFPPWSVPNNVAIEAADK
jgi:hypothetical protein